MVRGLPKSYIKKYGVSKRAWREYRKVHPKKSRSKSKSSKTKSVKRKGGRKMAKKKGTRRYKMSIPIAPVLGLVAGMAKPIQALLAGKIVGTGSFIDNMSYNYIGIRDTATDPKFEMAGLKRGLLPLVIGLLVHKFIGGYLGLNRMLGRARVPLIRL